MPRLAIADLPRALKSSLAPVYYIHGAEGVLKDEALAAILARALDPATRDFNLDIHSAQQLDPSELAGACSTLPMMAERRVVVLRDVENWKRKSKAKLPAVHYLEKPAPETVLVIVQGNDDDPDDELASRSTAVSCNAPVGEELDAWLDHLLDERHVSLTAEAREHLLRATGGDLGLLSAETLKLSAVAAAEPLGAEIVGELVGVRFGETVDDWRDAVLRDDTSRALLLLPKLLETPDVWGVRLVTVLGASMLVMRWARAVAERDRVRGSALARKVKYDLLFKVRPSVGSYDAVANVVGETVGRWSPQRITSAMNALLQADLALKNSTISDEGGIVTDLVLALATSRARKAA